MPTILDHFNNVADENLRKELIATTTFLNPKSLGIHEPNLLHSILGAFNWGSSRQGESYWRLISRQAASGKIPLINPDL